MIQSMTGYGKAEVLLENGKFTVEIRSVNAKNADISIKTSLLPREKEIWLRKLLAETLQRGSIDFFLNWEGNASGSGAMIDADTAMDYYSQIESLYARMGMKPSPEVVASILRLPGVTEGRGSVTIGEELWPQIENAITKALEAIVEYRSKEGEALQKDVEARVKKILDIYMDVEAREADRISSVRERILKAAEELKIKLDAERFEQEMIFYLEKLDITEEKVRLRQHCKYFLDTLGTEPYPGKKLGFIIQEMGREINTTGSKANDALIQKCVVLMKDELEKIREQSMNIL